MIAYFDASALVKAWVEEDGSETVRKLLAETVPATSRVTEIEVASALGRRHREGRLERRVRDRLLDRVRDDLDRLYLVELTAEVAAVARECLVRHPLRAADSIQLASALVLHREAETRVLFVAFDERLRAAAGAEGLAVFDDARR